MLGLVVSYEDWLRGGFCGYPANVVAIDFVKSNVDEGTGVFAVGVQQEGGQEVFEAVAILFAAKCLIVVMQSQHRAGALSPENAPAYIKMLRAAMQIGGYSNIIFREPQPGSLATRRRPPDGRQRGHPSKVKEAAQSKAQVVKGTSWTESVGITGEKSDFSGVAPSAMRLRFGSSGKVKRGLPHSTM